MFPIPGLPNPYILIGALVAIVIAWFAGDHHGYAKEHDKFIAFQGEVKAAGELAEAKTKAVIAGHEAVTQRTIADSNVKLSALQTKADDALKAMQAQHAATVDELQSVHISTTQQDTEGISNAYESKIAAIHSAYADRLRKSGTDPGSRAMSAFSFTSPESYDRTAYDYLAANCAVTTQMLISLQGWVREQGAVQ